MELKKFKQFRDISELVETYTTESVKVEIKKINGLFVVCMNGIQLESFRTKEAAEEAADDAVESLGNEE